jgi:ribonucleoside-diphosphate reductase alpha chain
MTQTTHERMDRYGLLPTPELSPGLSEIQLTDNARQVLVRRYVRRDLAERSWRALSNHGDG